MKSICYRLLFLISFILLHLSLYAQDDMDKLLDEIQPTTNYSSAGFKTTRVINGHSFENVAAGVLDAKISHRFGFLSGGPYEAFGLDQATIRIGLDYGITKRLMVGIGRSSYQKTVDGFAKYKLLRQSSGKRKMPVTLSLVSTMAIKTTHWGNPERVNYFTSRLFYTHQLIVGRKFSEVFSLQLMPSFVHRNIIDSTKFKNDIYAIGIAGRIKLSKRMAVIGEYYYVLPNQISPLYKNSAAIGFEIETGGHVFQLHFTNSTAMNEKGFITETTGDPLKGDIHFGFNISRVFTIYNRQYKTISK